MLKGKKIIIGITASIAAYKAAELIRLLIKSGAEVKVVMSPQSVEFVAPLTFATLSKNPVHSDFTEDRDTGEWTNHVDLGLWADLFVIAPCTANTLAKMVSGASDNFLLATFLSAKCPVMIAPAMDRDMYLHAATQDNLGSFVKRGGLVVDSEEGELASGLHGKGRMAEPQNIHDAVHAHFHPSLPLAGKKAIVSAGPTHEAIDPVRFIGNHSSGKMGFALAEELATQGATVTIVTGPSHQTLQNPAIERVDVVSAKEMLAEISGRFTKVDIGIMAAAVADFKPKNVADQKIKKSSAQMNIELEPTVDILSSLGEVKKEGQTLIGFALETENETAHAKDKLVRKNLDFIVINSLRDAGAGFGHDTNKISILDKNNKLTSFELKSKADAAKDIVSVLIDQINT
jgi:phosphopantothenoylcysteine decarboxylase/phosphopantothenate--cysteine ligase